MAKSGRLTVDRLCVCRNGSLTVDRLLMIFDMRYLKKTTPLQLSIDPIFLRFIPTFSNRICVVSQVRELYTLVNVVKEPVMMIWLMSAGRLKQCLNVCA